MAESTNPYDHLLIRTEEAVEVQVKDFVTVSVYDDESSRIRLLIANPAPFRFYVGYEIRVPEAQLNFYKPISEMAIMGHSTSQQYAVLYALGRIIANYGNRLPEYIAKEVKQAIFNYRQRSLF